MKEISREIIELALAGEEGAFEEIYRAYSGFVYSLTLAITSEREEALEVTQEVFIKVFKSLGNFEYRSSFKSWLYRVAVNTALGRLRKHSTEPGTPGVNDDFEALLDLNSPDVECAEKKVLKIENEEKLIALLALLSPEHRECIVLRELQGLSYREISDTLGININTVRTRLVRARLALMKHGRVERCA